MAGYRLFLSRGNVERLRRNPAIDNSWLYGQLRAGAIVPLSERIGIMDVSPEGYVTGSIDYSKLDEIDPKTPEAKAQLDALKAQRDANLEDERARQDAAEEAAKADEQSAKEAEKAALESSKAQQKAAEEAAPPAAKKSASSTEKG